MGCWVAGTMSGTEGESRWGILGCSASSDLGTSLDIDRSNIASIRTLDALSARRACAECVGRESPHYDGRFAREVI